MTQSSRVDELLLQWLHARQTGQPLSLRQLCTKHPALRALLLYEIMPAEQPERVGDSDGSADNLQPSDSNDDLNEALRETSFYSRLQFLAEGGLGQVYRGIEQPLGRDVAVKFMRQEHVGNDQLRHRFYLEAEITSRLQHPGIVPVYGLGETASGRPFYAMRFIEGIAFADAIRRYHEARTNRIAVSQQSLKFRELLSHFVAVCKTIAYAHNRGIIHCDLKPENVLLGRFGETIVVDWGLAVSVRREDRFRESGEETLIPPSELRDTLLGAGTGPYMSPEQMSGYMPTPASDIYSLGATLYELLTSQPPLVGQRQSAGMIRDRTLRGDIPTPRSCAPDVPRALEAICLHAIETRPSARYATALELARDIEAWLADEPVSVYRARWPQQLRRWLRRVRMRIALRRAT